MQATPALNDYLTRRLLPVWLIRLHPQARILHTRPNHSRWTYCGLLTTKSPDIPTEGDLLCENCEKSLIKKGILPAASSAPAPSCTRRTASKK